MEPLCKMLSSLFCVRLYYMPRRQRARLELVGAEIVLSGSP